MWFACKIELNDFGAKECNWNLKVRSIKRHEMNICYGTMEAVEIKKDSVRDPPITFVFSIEEFCVHYTSFYVYNNKLINVCIYIETIWHFIFFFFFIL